MSLYRKYKLLFWMRVITFILEIFIFIPFSAFVAYSFFYYNNPVDFVRFSNALLVAISAFIVSVLLTFLVAAKVTDFILIIIFGKNAVEQEMLEVKLYQQEVLKLKDVISNNDAEFIDVSYESTKNRKRRMQFKSLIFSIFAIAAGIVSIIISKIVNLPIQSVASVITILFIFVAAIVSKYLYKKMDAKE